jgi:hypothetical protein
LITAAIPSDSNVIQKKAEKKLKYKNSSIEIQRMWNMKCFVILVITGATGSGTKGVKEYLEAVPGKHPIDSLPQQKLLYFEHRTKGKYYNPEDREVGFTTGSRRGKIP